MRGTVSIANIEGGEGLHCKEFKKPLETESSHQGEWARKWGPQSYSHKQLNSANNLNKLGRGCQAPDENTDTLISALWDYEQRT